MKFSLLLLLSFLVVGCATQPSLRPSEQALVGTYDGRDGTSPLTLELRADRSYVLSSRAAARPIRGEWKEEFGFVVLPAPGNPSWSLKVSREGPAVVLSDARFRFQKLE